MTFKGRDLERSGNSVLKLDEKKKKKCIVEALPLNFDNLEKEEVAEWNLSPKVFLGAE